MKTFIKAIKAITIIIAILGSAYGGFCVGNNPELAKYFLARDWEFSRGVGQTEVRADYDWVETNVYGSELVYTEVLIWDEGFETYEVVKSGYYPKGSLSSLSEQVADETTWVSARF